MKKHKRLSAQVSLGRKVAADEPVIVHPSPAWRKYAKEHAAYEFIGIVSCGPQVGALAKTTDGSYVQLNGEWVTPLAARDVEAALRRAGATVTGARSAGGAHPTNSSPRLFGKPRERRSERPRQRQDESAPSLAQTERASEHAAEERKPLHQPAPQVPATPASPGVTVVLKKSRKRIEAPVEPTA